MLSPMKSAPSKAEDGVGAAEAVLSAGAALACGFTVEKNSGSPSAAILLMGVRTPAALATPRATSATSTAAVQTTATRNLLIFFFL